MEEIWIYSKRILLIIKKKRWKKVICEEKVKKCDLMFLMVLLCFLNWNEVWCVLLGEKDGNEFVVEY